MQCHAPLQLNMLVHHQPCKRSSPLEEEKSDSTFSLPGATMSHQCNKSSDSLSSLNTDMYIYHTSSTEQHKRWHFQPKGWGSLFTFFHGRSMTYRCQTFFSKCSQTIVALFLKYYKSTQGRRKINCFWFF